MLYSAIKNAFYPSALRADYEGTGTFPEDAKPISRELYDEVMSNRPVNKIMVPGPDGLPTLIDKPKQTLNELKDEKSSAIESDRNNAIVQSVTSNALGAPHTYNAKEENRNFLNNLITLGNGGKFTCSDADGVKVRRPHTHEQLLVLAHDIEAHISAQFDRYELKLSEIAAAATQAELEAITW
jgi:hypothetical protein